MIALQGPKAKDVVSSFFKEIDEEIDEEIYEETSSDSDIYKVEDSSLKEIF